MTKKRKFEAVLFDIDGTVIDASDFIFSAYEYTIKLCLKKKITFKKVAKVMGLPLAECYQLLTGLQEVEHLCKYHDEYLATQLSLVKAYPNALETLKLLSEKGIAIAGVTSRPAHMKSSLQVVGLDKFFKVIITPYEVKETKPHPKPLLTALKYLNVSSDKAVMIGDSPADMQAGKAAKVKTIAALYGFHGEKLTETKPDFLVNDIKEIISIIL